MFELIGMAVVAWVVWVIAKSIFRGAVRGQMMRTSDFAMTLGVPAGFAMEMSKDHDTLKIVREKLAANNNDFKALDVYKQFGYAIHAVYQASMAPSESELSAIKDKVKSLLKPQLTILKCENVNICINHISYAYIYTLAVALSEKELDLSFVRQVLKELLPEGEHDFVINNAFQVAEGDIEFADNCKDLLPVVQKEIAQGKGEYFVKQIRKANKEIDAMFSDDFDFDYDPSKVTRKSLLEV